MLIEDNDIFRELTNVNSWHDKGCDGKNVNIVILDGSGMSREHMNGYYHDVLGKENQIGHATNVGFTIHQFAPNAKIYMFDFMRNKSEAIKWITEHEDEIDLINVSLAELHGQTSPTFAPFEHLNIPLICASGNDDFEDRISYPARYDWTIAIGAVHYNYRKKTINVAGYSNEGERLDSVTFSGINMLRDDNYVFSVNGTSFASPTAVGMLACYIQWRKEHRLPKLTTEQCRKFIYDNCKDLYEPEFNTKSRYGLFILPKIESLEMPKQKESGDVSNQYDLPKGYQVANVEYQGRNVNGIIIDGRTYVQVRTLSEMLNLQIGWNPQTKTVLLKNK